ncbi:hypothetical protein E0Z10_g337 [Xylaria hypoxylon]|uniref:Uncharacterized protein n=1 Tax=Xylaria hypoxylon TaxID=37992 RepID=A0A4Z0Z9U0_9PEZI|nr:hypothetical protein E0Z10_g337 [Xylaria hypoxylon]
MTHVMVYAAYRLSLPNTAQVEIAPSAPDATRKAASTWETRDQSRLIQCTSHPGLALYRALLRLAPPIPLPDNLATGWGAGKNPIAIHVRQAFRRNVADVSPRIVYPALSAGYRMLSVLHDAATSPDSEHHASIIAFLESRLAERQRSLANRPPPPPSYNPNSATPRPGTIPLLVKVSPANPHDPESRPVYAIPHRPRPQSELGGTGRRKIPRLDIAADFPFLRFTKPQPAALSRVLGHKLLRRGDRATAVRDLWEETIPDAELEDDWEKAIAHLSKEEKGVPPKTGKQGRPSSTAPGQEWLDRPDANELSHAYTVQQYGIKELSNILTRERVDLVARAEAMRLLVIQEKALAAQEKTQRAVEKRTRWETRMLELHGEGWRDLFPNLKESEAVQR